MSHKFFDGNFSDLPSRMSEDSMARIEKHAHKVWAINGKNLVRKEEEDSPNRTADVEDTSNGEGFKATASVEDEMLGSIASTIHNGIRVVGQITAHNDNTVSIDTVYGLIPNLDLSFVTVYPNGKSALRTAMINDVMGDWASIHTLELLNFLDGPTQKQAQLTELISNPSMIGDKMKNLFRKYDQGESNPQELAEFFANSKQLEPKYQAYLDEQMLATINRNKELVKDLPLQTKSMIISKMIAENPSVGKMLQNIKNWSGGSGRGKGLIERGTESAGNFFLNKSKGIADKEIADAKAQEEMKESGGNADALKKMIDAIKNSGMDPKDQEAMIAQYKEKMRGGIKPSPTTAAPPVPPAGGSVPNQKKKVDTGKKNPMDVASPDEKASEKKDKKEKKEGSARTAAPGNNSNPPAPQPMTTGGKPQQKDYKQIMQDMKARNPNMTSQEIEEMEQMFADRAKQDQEFGELQKTNPPGAVNSTAPLFKQKEVEMVPGAQPGAQSGQPQQGGKPIGYVEGLLKENGNKPLMFTAEPDKDGSAHTLKAVPVGPDAIAVTEYKTVTQSIQQGQPRKMTYQQFNDEMAGTWRGMTHVGSKGKEKVQYRFAGVWNLALPVEFQKYANAFEMKCKAEELAKQRSSAR